ncbi:hypothetical protein ABT093_17665 [Kitasatospora sp. NPDC002551]|uniref:Rv1733c family protein n=1 Tax=Kitasatospora sp. NPDC002551 TaxID=3154539 RepID=UPI0033326ACC
MAAQQHRPVAHTPLRSRLRRASGLDHNPLCRPVDRARSRLVLALPVVLAALLAVSAAVAVLVFRAETRSEREAARHRHAVVATTVGPAVPDDLRTGSSGARAPARWSYPTGPGAGTIRVSTGTPVGTAVPIHVDDNGAPTAGARDTTAILSDAGILGLGTAAGLTSLAVLGCTVHRRALDRRAERSWEPEWERVEPLWTQRR